MHFSVNRGFNQWSGQAKAWGGGFFPFAKMWSSKLFRNKGNWFGMDRYSRDAKTLQTYKPGLEEGFGQKLRKVLLSKIKFYIVGIVLISVENKSSINT